MGEPNVLITSVSVSLHSLSERNSVGLIGDGFYSNYVPFGNWRGRSERSQANGISQEHGYSPFVQVLSPTNWSPGHRPRYLLFVRLAFFVVRCSVRLFVTRCDNAF